MPTKTAELAKTSITTSWPCEEWGLRVGDVVTIPFQLPRPWYARLWRQIRWRLFGVKDKPKAFVVTEISPAGDSMSITPSFDEEV